jgi:hypothetical protein
MRMMLSRLAMRARAAGCAARAPLQAVLNASAGRGAAARDAARLTLAAR